MLSFVDVWKERTHTLLRVLVRIEMEGVETSSRGEKLAVVRGESGKVEGLGPFAKVQYAGVTGTNQCAPVAMLCIYQSGWKMRYSNVGGRGACSALTSKLRGCL